jgi:hypothetical protein
MSKRKPQTKIFTGLFEDENGDDFDLNLRRYNENGNQYCMHPGCHRTAKHMGNGLGFNKYCQHHLYNKDSEYGDYRKFKYEIGYCENIDGRLGYKCTMTIVDWSMLEVDHINGVHKDNYRENFQCLCSCCHRFKTKHYRGKWDLDEISEIMNENRMKFTTTPTGIVIPAGINISIK